jgi:branched-chain amino acid transport system ATP-binding protein
MPPNTTISPAATSPAVRNPTPLLELQNISVSYDGLHAVRDVSMNIPPHTVVALIGANGAGKTTTLQAISGLAPVQSGQIFFDGKPLRGLAPHRIARQGIIHVPEGRGIFPALTVRENLEMVRYTVGHDVDVASQVSELFPILTERMQQAAGTLSGGQQQMLALARAFLGEPRLLLLDEISLGLAPIIVKEMFRAVRKVASTGVTVLLVEQYVSMALKLADYVYVLERGRIVNEGPSDEVARQGVVQSYLGV